MSQETYWRGPFAKFFDLQNQKMTYKRGEKIRNDLQKQGRGMKISFNKNDKFERYLESIGLVAFRLCLKWDIKRFKW